jgi:uncharacterized protein (TIGR03067 family)
MVRIWFLLTLAGSMALLPLARPVGAEDLKKKVNRELVGNWNVVSAEREGKELPEAIKATKWVITETTFTARLPLEGKGKFGYHVGEADKRSTIDIEVLESEWVDLGPRKRVYRGIYLLKHDTLTICYGPPYGTDKQRPTAFATKPGTGHTLFVLRREPVSHKGR